MTEALIGIDIGYGFTKTYWGGGSHRFPTAVTSAVPLVTFGDLHPVTANGETFLVGDEAVREGSGLIDSRTTTFVRSNAWLAVLGHALAAVAWPPQPPGYPVLVLGIPPGQYTKSHAQAIAETVQAATLSSHDCCYTFDQYHLRVIPQGAGMYFAQVVHDRQILQQDVAVVDMRYYTIDCLLFSRGTYVESATHSHALGISLLLDKIAQAFYRHSGLTITHQQAQTFLTTRTLTILETPYVIPQLSAMVAAYATQVASVIESFFDTLGVRPERALVGGGGVHCLQEVITLRHKLQVVATPELANAIGYWHYARGVAREVAR